MPNTLDSPLESWSRTLQGALSISGRCYIPASMIGCNQILKDDTERLLAGMYDLTAIEPVASELLGVETGTPVYSHMWGHGQVVYISERSALYPLSVQFTTSVGTLRVYTFTGRYHVLVPDYERDIAFLKKPKTEKSDLDIAFDDRFDISWKGLTAVTLITITLLAALWGVL